jgi:quercetin dioxygenase-like cupin family protein
MAPEAPELIVDYHEGFDISPHYTWAKSLGLPIHRGYFIEDGRTAELGWWEERQCYAAFVMLSGQEGTGEMRITEIPAGEKLPPLKFALDELVYVLSGRGFTTVWEGSTEKTFEWHERSMFLLPHGRTHQLSNAQGSAPVRLIHYNFLPTALAGIPYPEVFFNNDAFTPEAGQNIDQDLYSAAGSAPSTTGSLVWWGNFFPDLAAWDKLRTLKSRGAGGTSVAMQFPHSPHFAHMSVIPNRAYKKGHRHGPGFAIVIPAGEGFSVMWKEGQEKVFVPWHEGSIFIPPSRWFHQHFNTGPIPARYLAMHPPVQFAYDEKVDDRANNQIEYVDEDPAIRKHFEGELAKFDLTSLMPDEAYTNPDYDWGLGPGGE